MRCGNGDDFITLRSLFYLLVGISKNAPVEILTGQTLDQHWLDLIMDKVQAAFKEHGTSSLKELHALICKKENITHQALVKELPKLKEAQENLAAVA